MTAYTDRSPTNDSSSATFVTPQESISVGHRLVYRTSSTSAELYTILLFLQHASHVTPRAWAVYTDCQTALRCLASMGPRGASCPVGYDILCAVCRPADVSHLVTLQWIPAHSRLLGNVAAGRASAHVCQQFPLNVLTAGDRKMFLSRSVQPMAVAHWYRDVTTRCLPGSDVVAAIALEDIATTMVRLHVNATIFTAEPHAKLLALQIIETNNLQYSVIYSRSLSSVRELLSHSATKNNQVK